MSRVTRCWKEVLPAQTGGSIAPLWNILDREFPLAYAYLIRCLAGEKKGAYVHTKRTGHLYLLNGQVDVLWRPNWADGSKCPFETLPLRESDGTIEGARLPSGIQYVLHPTQDSLLLNLCDYPWISTEKDETILTPLSEVGLSNGT